MDNRLFETYKKSVMPHGIHIYATASAMAMDKMCEYPPYQHALPHWKCVLRCFLIYHVLIFQAKKKIGIITTHLLQYVFIFITQLHIVQCKEDAHWTKIFFPIVFTISGFCATFKTIHNKRACYDGYIYC